MRWILRELRNDLRFTVVFVLTLSLGMTGFLGLDSFRKSVERSLGSRARELLGADLAISARRPLTEAEVSAARDPSTTLRAVDETEFVEFFSMLNAVSGTRLVQVRAIEPEFPYYGQIVFRSGKSHVSRPGAEDFLWIDREIAVQLDLREGSEVKIWDKTYRVNEIIETDSSAAIGGSFMAPRAYVSLSGLEDRIGKFGSTLFYRRLFRFPFGADGKEIQRLVEEKISDPSVRVVAYNSAADESGRLIQYLSDYLGLVAVIGLLLASMGTFFLFQSYFSRKERGIALARCLGLSFSQIQRIYLVQILLLGIVSLGVGLLGVSAVRTVLTSAVGDLLPKDLVFSIDKETWFAGFLVATLVPLSLGIPFFARMKHIHPLGLVQEGRKQGFGVSQAVIFFAPTLLLFWGFSVWVSHSVRVGSLFMGTLLLLSLLVVSLFSLGIRKLPGILPERVSPGGFLFLFRLSSRNLRGHVLATILSALSVTVGALLMGLLPQIRSGLEQELQSPSKGGLPSLFFFDIQEDQASDLQSLLKNHGIQLRSLTPMVRARLETVNGVAETRTSESAETRTREDEEASRFRNRGVNLTFSDAKIMDSNLTEGFQLNPGAETPEISLESKYAERMAIRIGDQLKFDIQGVSVEGKVVNFRTVRWTSFEPNFFIQFGPGALEGAPKTFLATVPQATEDVKTNIQRAVASAFPNISAVDVSIIVGRILRMVDDMKVALYSMALFSIFVGWIVLFNMSQGQVAVRRRDLNLMKVIGLRSRPLVVMALIEFGAVSVVGIFAGIASSVVVAHVMGRLIFKQVWMPDVGSAVILFVLSSAMSLPVIWFAIRRIVLEKPLKLLQELD